MGFKRPLKKKQGNSKPLKSLGRAIPHYGASICFKNSLGTDRKIIAISGFVEKIEFRKRYYCLGCGTPSL